MLFMPAGLNAAGIVAEVQREGLPEAAAAIAVTTAIVESGLLVQANSNVPGSTSVPYQKVGNDGTSLGLFQQQNSWGTIPQRMDVAQSTALFLQRLPSGWASLDPGSVAQRIQVSAYPDRYDQNYSQGSAIAAALWGNTASYESILSASGNSGGASGSSGPGWKNNKGQPIGPPPDGTFKQTVDSSGKPEYVPTVTPSTMTDAQGQAIVAWMKLYAPNLNDWSKYVPPFTTKIPGAAPGYDTYGAVLINMYAQALQGNGLDAGAANPGFDIPNPLAGLEAIFSWLGKVKNWERIGLFVLGGITLLIVFIAWFKNTQTGGQVIDAAKIAAVA